jgi:hypothetical protein
MVKAKSSFVLLALNYAEVSRREHFIAKTGIDITDTEISSG